MNKKLILIVLSVAMFCSASYAQKVIKSGSAVIIDCSDMNPKFYSSKKTEPRTITATNETDPTNGAADISSPEQEKLEGEIVGYFGGDPANTMKGEGTLYPKQLVVASVDISNKEYKTTDTENASSIVNSIYYGRNMNIAAAALGKTELANYPAFEYCAGLNKDLNGNGKIDDEEMIWYLPSRNQLMAMWIFSEGLDVPFSVYYYWSATQFSITRLAWYVDFINGSTDINMKASDTNTSSTVRCVRDL